MSPQIDATERVLEALQEALKAELTAVHQYLLHAKVCQNWGYHKLAEQNRKAIKKDVETLYNLAAQLKADVQRTDSTTVLSLTLVKKAEEIEKLAKHIKTCAKS